MIVPGYPWHPLGVPRSISYTLVFASILCLAGCVVDAGDEEDDAGSAGDAATDGTSGSGGVTGDGDGDGDDCPDGLDCELIDANTEALETACAAAKTVLDCGAIREDMSDLECWSIRPEKGACGCGWIRELTVSDAGGACTIETDDGGACVKAVVSEGADTCASEFPVGDCHAGWAITEFETVADPEAIVPVIVSDTPCGPVFGNVSIPAWCPGDNSVYCDCAANLLNATCGG